MASLVACWAVSCACCVGSSCCSLLSCFTCRRGSPRAAKLVYLAIFFISAVLGIFLRYWGQDALGGVPVIGSVCTDYQCFGQQAAYRISGALFAFFLVLTVLTALFAASHLGAWLIKVLVYCGFLAVTLAIPNYFWVGYSQLARYGSVLFLLLQVFIIIDFAYSAHEWLIARMEAEDARLDAAGWEPGLLSNRWKVLYLSAAILLVSFTIAGLGVMFRYFAVCPLHQFFLAETLILGIMFILISLMNCIGKGLLPPCLLFAYNTYLCYGAITNNPDLSCNWAARVENENQASIITGLAIAAFSITWAAYSSARATAGVQLVTSPSTSPAPAPRETELREVRVGGGAASSSSSSAAAPEGTPASYAKEGGSGASGSASRALDSSSRTPAVEDDDDGSAANARPWLFHLVMALGGLYLAMLLTNWGTAVDASAPPTSYSEVSEPSMWVRIASQWAIYLVYAWTLFAPLVCKGRDFGS